ncbi:MAG: hypothetical protein Q9170_004987 [Blastenia crenularia]
MGTTITIDKSYFETLLRRAEFHVTGNDFVTPLDLPTVNVPKLDHDNLILIHGAQDIPEATAPLIGKTIGAGNGHFSIPQAQQASLSTNQWISRDPPTQFDIRRGTKSSFSRPTVYRSNHFQWPSSSGHDDMYFSDDFSKDESIFTANPKSGQPPFSKLDQRTILFKNLSDKVTHQDIVNVVRGGLLLDLYIRSQDKTANVSFVHGTAAQGFMAYVKRNDVYIHGRRLSFVWADRQYNLPGHVSNKIGIGATRNVVIRSIHPNITEKHMREDLDHIHNLVIVNLSFIGGDAFLSLNSIRNSLFARTCMMSRASYKGMQIEWYPDECALPLPMLRNLFQKENAPLPKPKEIPMVNRFGMLAMDDDTTENGSSSAEDDYHTTTSSFSPLKTSRRVPWAIPAGAA